MITHAAGDRRHTVSGCLLVQQLEGERVVGMLLVLDVPPGPQHLHQVCRVQAAAGVAAPCHQYGPQLPAPAESC